MLFFDGKFKACDRMIEEEEYDKEEWKSAFQLFCFKIEHTNVCFCTPETKLILCALLSLQLNVFHKIYSEHSLMKNEKHVSGKYYITLTVEICFQDPILWKMSCDSITETYFFTRSMS